MQFAYKAVFSLHQRALALSKVPTQYTLDTTQLESALDADDKSYNLRHYIGRVSGLPLCKPDQPDAHQRSYLVPDAIWLKAHHEFIKQEWIRHRFIATGVIPEAEVDDDLMDIISIYESIDYNVEDSY